MNEKDKPKKTPRPRWRRIRCDSCEVLVINNVVCHEKGCPRERERRQGYKEVPGLGRFKP